MLRILRSGVLSLAIAGLMLGLFGGVSGCGDGKVADGTMVSGAPPLSEEQKAMHKRFYDPAKRAAMKPRRR